MRRNSGSNTTTTNTITTTTSNNNNRRRSNTFWLVLGIGYAILTIIGVRSGFRGFRAFFQDWINEVDSSASYDDNNNNTTTITANNNNDRTNGGTTSGTMMMTSSQQANNKKKKKKMILFSLNKEEQDEYNDAITTTEEEEEEEEEAAGEEEEVQSVQQQSKEEEEHPPKEESTDDNDEESTESDNNLNSSAGADDDDDRRPILVLHIGPHKTATSTLQCQLTYYKEFLQTTANFTFLGRQYGECQKNKNTEHHHTTTPNRPNNHVDTRSLIRCLDQHDNKKTPCNETLVWKQFEKTLETMSQKQQNIIISDEAFSRLKINNDDDNLELLFNSIQQKYNFRLRIVIVYRHYFSWLVSQYNEHYKPLLSRSFYQKWPTTANGTSHGGGGGKPIKPFVDYYNNQQRQRNDKTKTYKSAKAKGNYQLAADRLNLHPVAYLKQRWTTTTSSSPATASKNNDIGNRDVVVINLHDNSDSGSNDDVLVNFVRHAISPDAANQLQNFKASQTNTTKLPSRENPSLNLDFDMLAVQARDVGLFPQNNKQLTRRKVAWYLEHMFSSSAASNKSGSSKMMKMEESDLPHVCLDENQIEEFRNRSLFLQETVFGGTSSKAEDHGDKQRNLQRQQQQQQEHREDFDKSLHQRKFCNLDTQQLLHNQDVQNLFESMNRLVED